MKKAILLFVLLVSTTCFAQLVAPKIAFQESVYDFGDLIEGEIVEHNFEIYNTGGDELKITKVRASCGCTAVKPKKDVLNPGESTTINVSFNTIRRSGKQKKHVYVMTNDPDKPEVRLSFTANIKKRQKDKDGKDIKATGLKFERYTHNFGRVTEGDVVEWNVGFSNRGENTVNIKEVSSSCGCTAAVMSSSKIKAGDKGELNIKFDTAGRSGKISRTVTVHSDDPVAPSQIITLYIAINKRKS